MTNRLFVALKLPERVVDEICAIRREISPADSRRWEGKEKLHMTLKFLGDVEESRTGEIITLLDEITSRYSPITCSYDRFGFFLPRILWAGFSCTGGALAALADEINNKFVSLGFAKEERKFKPHITLLRIKDNPEERFINAFKQYKLPAGEFILDEAVLMKSRLMPGGSVYSEVKSFYLK